MKNFNKELCKSCGACCKLLLIPTRFKWTDEDSQHFYRVRDITTVEDNMGGITLVFMDRPCPMWVEGEGCSVYYDRPYWCRIYVAEDDPILFDTCALRRKIDTGKLDQVTWNPSVKAAFADEALKNSS